jgi:hypothetical protein
MAKFINELQLKISASTASNLRVLIAQQDAQIRVPKITSLNHTVDLIVAYVHVKQKYLTEAEYKLRQLRSAINELNTLAIQYAFDDFTALVVYKDNVSNQVEAAVKDFIALHQSL